MENNINVVGMVIRAYLNNWRPAPTPPTKVLTQSKL